MNENETARRIVKLNSRPVPDLAADKFVVFRKIPYGPFDSAKEAHNFADKHWPGEEHEVYGLHDPAKI